MSAESAGQDAIRSLLHTLIDRVFEERACPVPVRREPVDPRRVASAIYQRRRERSKVLPRALLGEPAWDILLDLFANDPARRGVSTKSVCVAADVPYSTAWRCLGALASSGMVERISDSQDGRRHLVRLSGRGELALQQWLGSLSGLAVPAPIAPPQLPPALPPA